MEIRLLGTGGWIPNGRRETACVYLREGDDVVVLDAGTGFRRLLTDPSLLDGVERLRIVLTHFHLDHTYGLIGLPGLLARVPERELFAPGRLLAGVPATDLLERLLGTPFLAPPGGTASELLTDVHELEGDTAIGTFDVAVRVQEQHPGRSVALRLGDELAYCTDTAHEDETAAFARGVRVLIHEAFHPGETTDDPSHSSAGEAARVATAAEAGRLVLVHPDPLEPDDDPFVDAARTHFDEVVIGTDGLMIEE